MEVQVLSCALSENAAVFFTAAFFHARVSVERVPLSLVRGAQEGCKIVPNWIIQLATRFLDHVTMAAL